MSVNVRRYSWNPHPDLGHVPFPVTETETAHLYLPIFMWGEDWPRLQNLLRVLADVWWAGGTPGGPRTIAGGRYGLAELNAWVRRPR